MPLTRTAAFTASGLSLMNRLSSMVETLPGVARHVLRSTGGRYVRRHAGDQSRAFWCGDRRRLASSPGVRLRPRRAVPLRARRGAALGKMARTLRVHAGGGVRRADRPCRHGRHGGARAARCAHGGGRGHGGRGAARPGQAGDRLLRALAVSPGSRPHPHADTARGAPPLQVRGSRGGGDVRRRGRAPASPPEGFSFRGALLVRRSAASR
jgi:hypothetical protein